MGIGFNFLDGDDDELLDDQDSDMFGGAERYERRKAALKRAREIRSGISSGLLEKDELVFEYIRKLDEE